MAGRDERLAEQHYNQGVAAYEGERWSVAEVEFLASYALSGNPNLLHNLSRVAERMGQLADAIECEARYLETKPELDPRESDELRGRLARLREQLQTLPRSAWTPTLAPCAPGHGGPEPIGRACPGAFAPLARARWRTVHRAGPNGDPARWRCRAAS